MHAGPPLTWVEETAEGAGWVRDICPLNAEGVALEAIDAASCWQIGPFEGRLAMLQARHDGGALQRTRSALFEKGRVMDERQNALRLYTVVGALIGLTIGLFTHGQLAFASGVLVAVWLGVFGVLGLAVGRMLYLVQLDDDRDALPKVTRPLSKSPRPRSLRSRAACTRRASSRRCGSSRVAARAPELELRLLVEDHDTALGRAP